MSAAFAVSTSQSRAGPTVSHRRRSSPAISPQVAVKLDYHGLQADPSRPAGRLPDPLLEAVYGLRGNPPLGVLARREAEPRKLVRKGRVTALFSLFTLSFEVIEVDVRQERRERPSLRGSPGRGVYEPLFHDPRAVGHARHTSKGTALERCPSSPSSKISTSIPAKYGDTADVLVRHSAEVVGESELRVLDRAFLGPPS